jgi:hypothetical protein
VTQKDNEDAKQKLRASLDYKYHEIVENSGIDPEVALKRGYYHEKTKAGLGRLGFKRRQQRAPAIVIPRFAPSGEEIPPQIKPDNPNIELPDGSFKDLKYETVAGSTVRLSVHPRAVEVLRDTRHVLWVTEGDKKGDSLVSHGAVAVVLQGVGCWNVPQDWEDIKLYGRTVIIAFDADVIHNPEVGRELEKLSTFLKRRGASVKYLKWPEKYRGTKTGVDDYLANGDGTVQDLYRLAQEAPDEGSIWDSWDSSDSFSEVSGFTVTPSFPTDALPPKCAKYVKEAAASLSCAPELVAIPVIATLSGAIGYSRVIRIKPGWPESASMYLAVVDEPGSRKSPAASLAYKPIEKLQGTLRKAYQEEKKTYEAELRQHVVDKKLAAREDKPEPEPPVRPVMKRCIVDDITIEALATRLEQNPRGFVSHQDELTGFMRGMDQYKSGGKGNTRQAYLKIWSNRGVIVDRKGSDEPVSVPKPYLTLQGGIQPSVLHEIAAGREDGFLDRFDFAYPEPRGGGYSEETISHIAEIGYETVIGRLWDQGPKEADDGGELEPEVVRMDEDAKKLFIDEAKKLSEEMNSPGFPSVLRGPWSKFDTKLVWLILIISTAREAEGGVGESKLATGEDARAALQLLEYFKATTKKVYGQLFEAKPDDVLAADLVTLLKGSGYIYSGTISKLMEQLESNAKPDTPEALGKAIRRIAKASPALHVETGKSGSVRTITITM